jgi:AcrR family transcriptional regulator
MDAIAEAAGVTKPVLYDSFASKSELFAALQDREERRLRDALAASLPAEIDLSDPQDAISQGFAAFFTAVEAAPDAYRLMLLEEQGVGPGAARRAHRARTEQAERIAEVTRPWLERQGHADVEGTARLLGHAMVGVGEALGRLMLAEPGRWEPDALGRMVATLVMHGATRL